MRKSLTAVAALAIMATGLAACSSTPNPSTSAAGAKGGDLVIVRPQDSVSMDNTMVFSNASIWVFQQMLE